MSTKKTTSVKRERMSEKGARLKCLVEPFFLPGDIEPLPEKPCSVNDLLTRIAKHLDSVASPDFGGITFTEEERMNERITWANAAMRELWNWIAAHAVAGDATAQGKVFESALDITSSFIACARQKLPGIVKRAEKANLIPGYISVDKCSQESMKRLCKDIGQGTRFPFPLEAPGVKGKKQKGKLSTAQHDLVNRLWSYMEDHRLRRAHAAHFAEVFEAAREDIHPLVLAMMELPPLSPETLPNWKKAGRQVIENHTDGNPKKHLAFQPGGFFASLGLPVATAKRQEITLWKRLDEAWELRAESMAALPADSPNRKAYSRR